MDARMDLLFDINPVIRTEFPISLEQISAAPNFPAFE